MAKEGEQQLTEGHAKIIVPKMKKAYVLTPNGEFMGPVKVVGPAKFMVNEAGNIVETWIRAYGPETPPQGSGWMVYKEVHMNKIGNRIL